MSAKLIDILLAEIFKAFAAAVCKAAVEVACKYGKRILNCLMGKSDNEADDGLENNHKRLMDLADELFLKRDDILAKKEAKIVAPHVCEDWISRVRKSEEEVRELESKYKIQSQYGSSQSSTGLSKSMKKKCDELHLRLTQEPRIRTLVEKLPEHVIIMPKSKPEDKPFLEPIVKEILRELKLKDVKTIGIWGKSEIGKTTILQSLNNNEDTAEMFDIVIWVTLSEDLCFKKLQHIIANRLKLNIEGITDSNEIYHLICQELKSKRFLLLLDDASGSFHSSLITLYGNEKDSKVVLTARTKLDCWEMGVNSLIPVKPMPDLVAWKIFKEKVGAQNIDRLDVQPIAELVAKECAGFPSLIDKVARKFRRRDSYELWMEGYKILQNWHGTNIHDIDQLLTAECEKYCDEN